MRVDRRLLSALCLAGLQYGYAHNRPFVYYPRNIYGIDIGVCDWWLVSLTGCFHHIDLARDTCMRCAQVPDEMRDTGTTLLTNSTLESLRSLSVCIQILCVDASQPEIKVLSVRRAKLKITYHFCTVRYWYEQIRCVRIQRGRAHFLHLQPPYPLGTVCTGMICRFGLVWRSTIRAQRTTIQRSNHSLTHTITFSFVFSRLGNNNIAKPQSFRRFENSLKCWC